MKHGGETGSSRFRLQYLHSILLHASAGFEVGADALAGAFLEFWELSAAGFDDSLDLLLGLFRDGHHPVQVLIHEKAHKHLKKQHSCINYIKSYKVGTDIWSHVFCQSNK